MCYVRGTGHEFLQGSYSLLIDRYCAAFQALLLLRDEDAGGENFVPEVERGLVEHLLRNASRLESDSPGFIKMENYMQHFIAVT